MGARRLEVPFVVRAVAARPRGGAYVLGAGGLLARYSARGALSGVVQTKLRTLVTSHDFVCGLDAEGWMSCARDSSQDRVCAESSIGTFTRVGRSPLRALSSDLATDRFCLLDHAGRRTCASARAPCDRSCIAFPACSRPRCIDPCPAPSEPGRPGVAGLDFFSSATTPTATYPE